MMIELDKINLDDLNELFAISLLTKVLVKEEIILNNFMNGCENNE